MINGSFSELRNRQRKVLNLVKSFPLSQLYIVILVVMFMSDVMYFGYLLARLTHFYEVSIYHIGGLLLKF